MRIFYDPRGSPTAAGERSRYVREYVLPLGRGRQAVRVEGNALIFLADESGFLSMTLSLLDRAVDPMRDSLELAEVTEYPPDGWYGNFEPGSPSLDLKRDGPTVDPPGGFSLETSQLRIHEGAAKSDKPSHVNVLVSGPPEAPLQTRLAMKAEDLVALAKDCASLSQSPDGTRIDYPVAWGKDRKKGIFRMEKRHFPTDSPWGELPSKTRESMKKETHINPTSE